MGCNVDFWLFATPKYDMNFRENRGDYCLEVVGSEKFFIQASSALKAVRVRAGQVSDDLRQRKKAGTKKAMPFSTILQSSQRRLNPTADSTVHATRPLLPLVPAAIHAVIGLDVPNHWLNALTALEQLCIDPASCTSGLAPIKKKLSIAIILLLSLEHGLLGFRGVMQRS